MNNNEYRELNPSERGVLDKLLSSQFVGVDQIREQVSSANVKTILDGAGNFWGIEFKVKSNVKADVQERVPVSAISRKNGPCEILLHVIDGTVKELELVQYDDQIPNDFPSADDIEVRLNNDTMNSRG